MNILIRSAIPFLGLLVLLASSPVQAQRAAQPQALVSTAVNLTAVADQANGRTRANNHAQGADVLRYGLVFTNVTDKPVRQIVLSNAIPTGFRLVPGSVSSSSDAAQAEYSADGGQTFSARPMEEVVIDGQRVRRAISPDRYTHVRWTLGEWVAPQASVTAHFDAQIGRPAAPAGTSNSTRAGSRR